MATRQLFIGIDSGTQSTKALVVDGTSGNVLAESAAAYGLIPGLGAGAKEQHPHTWKEATKRSITRALKACKAKKEEVVGIGVSGQQHGFVPMDKHGEVIRPAKLWCDTSTAKECEEIMERLGGSKATLKALGNAILPGFPHPRSYGSKNTSPKITKNWPRSSFLMII